MLVGEAGRFAGFRLERGVTVRDLVREGERVVGVRADTPAGSRAVRGDLVVGADGRASVLRARAGLRARRAEQAFDVVWCKVPQPTFLDQSTARAYLGHRHFALLFPSYDGRLQVGWIIDKGSFGDLRRLGIEGWRATPRPTWPRSSRCSPAPGSSRASPARSSGASPTASPRCGSRRSPAWSRAPPSATIRAT